MSEQTWLAVDEYINELVVRPDAALDAAIEATAAAGMPAIAVSAAQGKLLQQIVTLIGAHRVLEVGTLGGYSSIWMARALPAGGSLVSLELDAKHAEVARSNLAGAGLGEVAEVRVGPALESLPKLAAEVEGGAARFDLTFIDADKVNIPAYFDWALRLSRPGAVIIVDNVVRNGGVLDQSGSDGAVVGVRQLNDVLAARPDISATTIQTVGSKGYDGFTLAIVPG